MAENEAKAQAAVRLSLCAVILWGAAAPAPTLADGGATQEVLGRVRQMVDKQYPSLETLYTTLHKEPELSLAEEKTSKRLAEQWRSAGFEVTERVGGFGVVGVLRNGAGKTLLIRTDLDALPVKENTGAPYRSTAQATNSTGQPVDVMHACGHDVHVTCISGVARAMAELKDKWKGTLVLIGQPAEEVGKGAAAMLADGLFTRFPRPDWCLALHVDAEMEAGKVGYVSGYAMANVDSVDVVIRGVGGHGAMPHMGKDPVVIAAQVVLALQTIDSREIDPVQPVVVTVGSIHGGTKHNVIPDEVVMQLTVRSYTDEVREKTLKAIERIAKGMAQAAGVPEDRMPTVTVRDPEFTPATYNTPELVERVVGVLKKTIGEQNVIKREPVMGGEDFSRYGREEPKIPIFMYRLGSISAERIAESKKSGGKPLPSLHSAQYLPAREATIKTGVTTMTAAAVDLLQ
jgi:hippurate hydrolase